MSDWFSVKDRIFPKDLEVVIIEFEGEWPHHSGNGGIRDSYRYAKKWWNIPDSVEVIRWMYI